MADYYVNPGSGSNGNPGTEAQPFATIAHLKTVWSAGDRVFLARGYDYGDLSIVNTDGTALNPYTWDAYGIGTNPIFSGFIDPGTNWVSEGGNLYSYTNASFQDAKFMLIGGERKAYGRWPKRATAEYYDIDAATGNTQITDNTNLSGQPSYVGGEMVTKKRKWTIDRSPITAQTSTTLTMTGADANFVVGNGYFVQNHQNACTENGEWAFDAANDKIYLYSTTDPDTLDIKISFQQYAAHIDRSDYHIFNNIIFEGAYDVNIYADQSNHLTFNNCTCRYAGVNGLQTFVATNLTWNDGAMYDINNHGINNRDASTNLTVTGSSFVRIADIPGMGASGTNQQCGIFINNTEHDNTLTDNYFFQIGNCGIYFRANNSYVARNFAQNCAFTVSDAACFYTFGNFATPYTGIICEENIAIDTIGNIDGIGGTPKFDSCGIYTDDNSKNVIVRRNYVSNCSYGLYIHNNQDVDYNNNIVYDCARLLFIADDEAQGASTTLRVRNIDVQNNVFKALAGQDVVACRTIGAFSGSDPFLYGTIDNNQIDAVDAEPFYATLTFNFETNYNLADWRSTYSFDVNSNTTPYDISKTIYKINTTTATDSFPLTNVYKDWDDLYFRFGEITLEPNESRLLFEQNAIDPKIGTILFQENWENGTTNWNTGGELDTSYIPATASSVIVTDQALSGTHSLRMRSENDLGQTNNFRYTEPNNNADFIATFWLYFPAKIDLVNNFDSFANLIQTKGVNLTGDERNDPIWVLGLGVRGGKGTGGNNYLTLSYLGQFWPEFGVPQQVQTPLETLDIPISEWFKIQVRYLKSEDNGVVQVWQDDTLLFEKRQGITFPDSLVGNLFMSVNSYGEQRLPSGAGNVTDIYLDDTYLNLISGSYDFGDRTLTLNSGGNGTVSQDPEGVHGEGDEIVLTATPDSGYEFEGWYDGITLLSVDNPYTYIMPAINKTITGQFIEESPTEFSLNLQVDPAGAGNATQNPASPHETATAVTLTATVNPSYVFLGWFDGATELSTDNPYIYTTGSENKILTAKFEINLSGPFIKKGKWKPVTIT